MMDGNKQKAFSELEKSNVKEKIREPATQKKRQQKGSKGKKNNNLAEAKMLILPIGTIEKTEGSCKNKK